MERYQNLGGSSGVEAYEISDNAILVRFTSGDVYSYTYQSAGTDAIEEMKRLAKSGSGLNHFIMKNVRKKYAEKW